MYRKTYAGLIGWLIVFCALCIGMPFAVTGLDETSYTRILVNLCTLGIAFLAFIIWRTEYVYWYNGVSFEDAEKAGSERRKAYAFRHFRLFGLYAMASLAFTMGGHLIGWPWWVDMVAVPVGLIAAAFRTMAYKL